MANREPWYSNEHHASPSTMANAPAAAGKKIATEPASTLHHMHVVAIMFTIVAMGLCIAGILTTNWYVITDASGTVYIGLFKQCNASSCKSLNYDDMQTSACPRKGSDIKLRHHAVQGLVIFSAAWCAVVVIVAGLGAQCISRKAVAILVLVFSTVCWVTLGAALGRFAVTYMNWLYCDVEYCTYYKTVLKQSGICENSFGYSFAFVCIGLAAVVLAWLFALIRLVAPNYVLIKRPGDPWSDRVPVFHLQQEDEDGGDADVDEEEEEEVQTHRERPRKTLDEAQQPHRESPQQQRREEQPHQQARSQARDDHRARERQPATATRRDPSSSTPPPQPQGHQDQQKQEPSSVQHQQQQQQQQHQQHQQQHKQQQQATQRADQAPATSSPAAAATSSTLSAKRQAPIEGDWEWDEDAKLFWSEGEFLYLDPDTMHYFDPNSSQWYDPELDRWYQGDPIE